MIKEVKQYVKFKEMNEALGNTYNDICYHAQVYLKKLNEEHSIEEILDLFEYNIYMCDYKEYKTNKNENDG